MWHTTLVMKQHWTEVSEWRLLRLKNCRYIYVIKTRNKNFINNSNIHTDTHICASQALYIFLSHSKWTWRKLWVHSIRAWTQHTKPKIENDSNWPLVHSSINLFALIWTKMSTQRACPFTTWASTTSCFTVLSKLPATACSKRLLFP